MTWQLHQLLAMANLLICLCIAWACLCRLNSHICRAFKLARARYSLLLAGALASGAQPLFFNSWPTVGSVVLAAAVLVFVVINVVRWYPPHMKKRGSYES